MALALAFGDAPSVPAGFDVCCRRPPPPPTAGNAKIFFTIVAWNYIAYAATLMASIARVHPEARRYVIVCDAPANNPNISLEASILYPNAVEIPDLASMQFVYDVMEYATAIKPYAFLYFHRYNKDAHVLYVDPDLFLIKPLDHVFGTLSRGAGLVLTPHMMRPLQDGKQPDDLTIMKSGVYNLGFLGTSAEEEALLFLRWWADRCRRDAVVDIPNHRFTDQRWVDLAPAFVGSAFILRHPGYNIAYWNLAGRVIGKRGDTYTSNGEDIHFLHFSGVVPSNDKVLSKHQDRFEVDDLPIFTELLRIYLKEILSNHWKDTTKIPYHYNFFSNRRPIHKFMRASFRRYEEDGTLTGEVAFASGGAVFDAPEPSLAHDGPPAISRVMFELWMARLDLQRAFNVRDATGRGQYLNWFIDGGAKEAGLDDISIEAARKMLAAPSAAAPRRTMIEPWRPLASNFVDIPADELSAWLAAPVPIQVVMFGGGVYLPHILALLWEGRADLRLHFQLQDEAGLETYLTWCLTNGVLEGNVPIDLIGDQLGAYLSGIDGPDEDNAAIPPQTRLLRFVRGNYAGPYREIIERTPDDYRANVALCLWLCGAARRKYLVAARHADTSCSLAAAAVRLHLRHGTDPQPDPCLLPHPHRCAGGVQDLHPRRRAAHRRLVRRLRRARIRSQSRSPGRGVPWLAARPCAGRLRCDLCHRLPDLARPSRRAGGVRPRMRGRTAPVALGHDRGGEGPVTARLARGTGHGCARGIGQPGQMPAVPDRSMGDRFGARRGSSPQRRRVASAGGAVHHLRPAHREILRRRRRGDQRRCVGDPAQHRPPQCGYRTVGLHRAASRRHRARLLGGLLGVELERVPEMWNFAYTFYREIWAATSFAYDAFSHGNKRNVYLMPMAVDLPQATSSVRRTDFGFTKDEFIFYYGFDVRSYVTRKNPQAAIAAFRKAFGDGKLKVRLLLKTLAFDFENETCRELLALAADDPHITFLDKKFNREELYALISDCDCFVSPHRSEGFGRGPAEAMLLGVPVIATNYSGNVDFTTRDTALLVDYKLIPLKEGDYPGGTGQHWADIDVDALAEAMRRMATEPQLRHHLTVNALDFISTHYSLRLVSAAHAQRVRQIMLALNV